MAKGSDNAALETAYQRGIVQGQKKGGGISTDAVKKLMNGMYKDLKAKFVTADSYDTSQIMKNVLDVIKDKTNSLIALHQGKNKQKLGVIMGIYLQLL